MSKSLKNTVSVWEFLEEYSPEHLRTLCMLVPYRNGVEYSREIMANAVGVHSKIVHFLSDADAYIRNMSPKAPIDDAAVLMDLSQTREKIHCHLLDDFNTSSAMSELVGLIGRTSSELNSQNELVQGASVSVLAVRNFVKNFLVAMGFESVPQEKSNAALIERIMESSLALRSSIRQQALTSSHLKEHKETKTSLLTACDEFRNRLKDVGIEIKDRSNTSTWNQMTASKPPR